MNFLMSILTAIALFLVYIGARNMRNKRRQFKGLLFLVAGGIALMCVPFAQREKCTLVEVKTIPVPYSTYTTYHTYLYFEDSDGNVFKRSIEDMGTKEYNTGEEYKINTWVR